MIEHEHVMAVVVAYQDMQSLQKCFLHLFDQTMPLDKIIVVDNSATSAVALCIADLPEALQQKIDYLRCTCNIGSAGGFSMGMSRAHRQGAQWIWLHDEDDYPDQHCLKELLSLSAGPMRAPLIIDPATGKTLRYFKRIKGWLGYFYPASPGCRRVDIAGTAGLLIHRDVITRIGLYDADFFVGYEDYDYCLRAKAAGISVCVAAGAQVFHPDHQSAVSARLACLEQVLACLPSFWGFIREGSHRDFHSTKNYITISKRHKSLLIVGLELILSLCIVPVFKIIDPRIRLRMTLKTYFKTLCAG